MNKDEYKKQKSAINLKHDMEIMELDKQYALENNQYKLGDVIRDHIGSGVITAVKMYRSHHGYPKCLYRVNCYTRAGKPAKREPYRYIYEGNIIK